MTQNRRNAMSVCRQGDEGKGMPGWCLEMSLILAMANEPKLIPEMKLKAAAS